VTYQLDEAEASDNWDQSEFEKLVTGHVEGTSILTGTDLQTISTITNAFVKFALDDREESASRNSKETSNGVLPWTENKLRDC